MAADDLRPTGRPMIVLDTKIYIVATEGTLPLAASLAERALLFHCSVCPDRRSRRGPVAADLAGNCTVTVHSIHVRDASGVIASPVVLASSFSARRIAGPSAAMAVRIFWGGRRNPAGATPRSSPTWNAVSPSALASIKDSAGATRQIRARSFATSGGDSAKPNPAQTAEAERRQRKSTLVLRKFRNYSIFVLLTPRRRRSNVG